MQGKQTKPFNALSSRRLQPSRAKASKYVRRICTKKHPVDSGRLGSESSADWMVGWCLLYVSTYLRTYVDGRCVSNIANV